MTSLTGKEAQKKAFLKITRVMIAFTVTMTAAVAILIGYVVSNDPWVWMVLNTLTNIVSYAAISVLLYLAKVPEATDMTPTKNQEQETRESSSLSLYRTVSLKSLPSNGTHVEDVENPNPA
mmetsp:Transcript_14210/g.19804  ORF Transcript_14210/g.19804 Transcript_14210/m.19804 type:complete len:121 (-) Transcript_14210:27-389(-)